MALRVLLADESPTIKKAIQLALQDFAVDVRSVNVGIDVLSVARSFHPEIIFSDVMLQKKNGYEVCAELKSQPDTLSTPVVLMWSAFMELDEGKFKACGANGRIEKPFDVTSLRQIVKDLVPKTQTHTLSDYLSFPNLPELEDSEHTPESLTPPTPPVLEDEFNDEITHSGVEIQAPNILPPLNSEPGGQGMQGFDPVTNYAPLGAENDNFQEVNLTPQPSQNLTEDDGSAWVQTDINQIHTEAHELSTPTAAPEKSSAHEASSFSNADSELQVEDLVADEFVTQNLRPERRTTDQPGFSERRSPDQPQFSEEQIKEYIQSVCRTSVETLVREMIPQIAKEVIEVEIQKLTHKL